MPWIGGALAIGGSLISGMMGSSASSSQADAANTAAQMQANSSQAAIAAQKDALATQRADLQPYTQLGNSSLSTLAGLLGQDKSMTPEQMMSLDPGYQFRMQQGQTALEGNQALSRGPGLSGATLKELTQYGQDYASNEFNNVFARQMGAANLGQASAAGQANMTGAAANSIGNAGMAGASGAGNYLTQGANAQAAGMVGAANGVTGAINNYNSQQTLKSIFSNQSGNQFSNVSGGGGVGTTDMGSQSPLYSGYTSPYSTGG